jgi:hypothetical protein
MTRDHLTPKYKNKKYNKKEYDFIPNKEQIIMGALKDLGKKINYTYMRFITCRIATMYDEDLV